DWINDWYDADYYKISPEDNPTGPVKGDKKVLRGSGGASYWSNLVILRFSDKGNGKEGRAGIGYGFRCVLNEPKPL
ncbi:SUMF1/EgtB/PvdO family nonheme iron enzyme, partial [Escherichia coli]